jgi:hypothetical protein
MDLYHRSTRTELCTVCGSGGYGLPMGIGEKASGPSRPRELALERGGGLSAATPPLLRCAFQGDYAQGRGRRSRLRPVATEIGLIRPGGPPPGKTLVGSAGPILRTPETISTRCRGAPAPWGAPFVPQEVSESSIRNACCSRVAVKGLRRPKRCHRSTHIFPANRHF